MDMTSARMVDIARTYLAEAAKDWFLNVYASRCQDLFVYIAPEGIDPQIPAAGRIHVQKPILRRSG